MSARADGPARAPWATQGTCEPVLAGMAGTACDRGAPLLRAGNTNCGGCGMSITLNMLSRAIGARRVQLAIPACCGIVTAGPFRTRPTAHRWLRPPSPRPRRWPRASRAWPR